MENMQNTDVGQELKPVQDNSALINNPNGAKHELEVKETLTEISAKMNKAVSKKQGKAFMRVLQFFAIMVVLTIFVRGAAGATMPIVTTTRMGNSMITKSIDSTGVIRSIDSVKIDVPVGLKIKKIHSPIGTNVNPESKLIEFDLSSAEDEILKQEQALLGLEQEYLRLQESTELDDTSIKSAQKALESAEKNQSQMQSFKNDAQNSYNSAQNALNTANDNANSARANLENVKAQGEIDIANALAIAQGETATASTAAGVAQSDLTTKESLLKDKIEEAYQSIQPAPPPLDPPFDRETTTISEIESLPGINVNLLAAAKVAEHELAAAQIAYDNAVNALTAAQEFEKNAESNMRARVNERIAAAQNQVDAAASEISIAQSALKDAESALKLANENLEDANETVKSAKESLADAKKQYEAAKKDSKLAEQIRKNNLTLKQKQIKEQEVLIAELKEAMSGSGILMSPTTGAVVNMNVSEGAVTADDSFIEISTDNDGYIVETQMSQTDAGQVNIGGIIYVDHPVWQWQMEAKVVAKSALTEAGTVMVTASLGNERGLAAGSSTKVSIVLSSRHYYSTVPLSAIQSDNDGNFIYVLLTKKTILGDQQVAQKVKITINESGNGVADISFEDYGVFYDSDIVTGSTKPLSDGVSVRVEN